MPKPRVTSTLKPAETNMTSMIDVVFLLISFFTLVMNFSQAEQHEEIQLPKSELAQPPEVADAEQITVQALHDGTLIVGTVRCAIENNSDYKSTSFGRVLGEELNWRKTIRKVMPDDVTIVVRGDGTAETGFIQETIAACQAMGTDSFVLRARQVRDDQ